MQFSNSTKHVKKKILKANNLGAFYKFVNGKLNTHNGIAPLTDPHGNVLTSDVDKANLLNDFFKSVFTQDNGTLPHFPSRLPPNSPAKINDINITETVIKRILSKLKTNSAPGPDRLPPIFYSKTSSSISFPLCIIFRTFIDLKNLPAEWKKSIVTPKFKKGNPSVPSNYRPIALTCTCCKVLESIISGELNDYLLEHNLISKTQHGFLKRHSTTTNLLESLHDLTLSLSNHKSVIIATIDFQRAFDSISHSKLIHKLKSYGISGNLLFWLQSFLTARTQCVRVGSALSNTCSVSSGVPQGSVVGALLFLLFINDISDNFDNSITTKLFADDLKIYTDITFPTSTTSFQNHLNLFHSWSLTWQLGISYSKCNILQLGAHYLTQECPALLISDHIITQTSTITDLGIQFDDKLKFTNHIHDITNRAYQRSNMIFRCFLSKDTSTLIRAYKTYVRPLLEYNSVIWSPSQIGLINSIESVQRSFTKRLPSLNNLSYSERLSVLGLQTLEHRRLITDLLTCYNIINGHSALKFSDFFTYSPCTTLRGHQQKLQLPLCKNNTSKYFFSSRIIKPWNSLAAELISIQNPKLFKKYLNQINLSDFLTIPYCNHK